MFHGATLQRISATRRETAIPLDATPRHGPPEPALAPLLTATESSSSSAASALTDSDLATSWSEARPGRGQGEFVVMHAPFDVPIVRFAVTVAPTHPRPEGAAPETFYLATNAATYEVTMPEDAWSHPGEAYDIALPEPLRTSCVALVLADAFTRGRAHPEVTVAELTAYSAFDHAAATLAEVAMALEGGDAKAEAAAALLERAGGPGIAAMAAAYPTLGPAGRALALNVAASASSCEASAPLFTAALADADEVVRGKALAKLQQPACGRQALPALVLGLRSDATRAKVAPLVALLGRETVLGALSEWLGVGTPADRHALQSAVADAARGAAPSDLAALLEGSARRSPDASLDALRALRDRLADVRGPADASIAGLLGRRAPADVRYLLVDVLAPLAAAGDSSAQASLADLIERDPAPEVRARAAELAATAAQPEVVMAAALKDPAPRVREAALRSVAALRPAALSAPMADLLARDPWTFVRVAAAVALSSLPASSASDRALAEAAVQLSPRVREQAILGIAAHGATAYRELVRRHLTDPKEDPAVRAASARGAGALCDVGAIDALVSLAVAGGSSPSPDEVALGLVATEALGALHPRDLAARFGPLGAKGVRPDARTAGALSVAGPGRCPLP